MQPAIDGPDAGGFGAAVAAAGDTNGDGFADVIVGAPAQNTNQPGHAYIYYGSATGLGATPTSIVGPDDAVIPDGYNGEFGLAVTCAGDVNGDGYSDVLVGAENANQSTGRAYVFHGGGSGVSKTAASVMTGHGLNSRGTFGSAVASAGDVNGDGYSDIIVGGYCDVETVDTNGFTLCGNGEASLYLGSSSGLGGTPSAATVFVGPSAVSHLGVAVAGGDVNGDGFCDVLFSDAPNGTIWGFLGGSRIADPGTGVTNFGISLH
jgi:hypothetical protein